MTTETETTATETPITDQQRLAEGMVFLHALSAGRKIEHYPPQPDQATPSLASPAVVCSLLSAFFAGEFDALNLRIRPLQVKIGNRFVPAGETEPLSYGTAYFVPRIPGQTQSVIWTHDASDFDLLNAGYVHLTREAADEVAAAFVELLTHPE